MTEELKSIHDVPHVRSTPCKSTIRFATDPPDVTRLFKKHRVAAELERTKMRRVTVLAIMEIVVTGAALQSVSM